MHLTVAVLALISATPTPDWVKSGGRPPRYPAAQYLVGFAMIPGGTDAIERAKAEAAADVARQIEVRIESDMRDLSAEKDGAQTYSIAAYTRASTDVRLTGLSFETYREDDRTYALAVLDRAQAAAQRRAECESALERLRACLLSAEGQERTGQKTLAVKTYLSCRGWLSDALAQASMVTALGGNASAAWQKEAGQANARIDAKIAALLAEAVLGYDDAVGAVGLQLGMQGVSKRCRLSVAPLTYGNTDFSSPFGQRFAADLETIIAQQAPGGDACQGEVAVRGVYVDSGGHVEIKVTARRTTDGRFVGGAATSLPTKAVPPALPLLPRNFQQALEDNRLLGKGEVIDGDLRLELWTNKGFRNLVFKEKEEMQLFLRVNQPAYLRLVYILQSGQKVMLEQAYYIDASKVNLAVQYPDVFEIAPPFGVEQVFATAFTKKPDALPTITQTVDGQAYEVVTDGTSGLVRYRGIARKDKGAQTAEATIAVTTTPNR